jgi:hypothetical protein
MKVTVNIDCTPEEARTFFGLPDLRPMQEALLGEMQKQMQAGLKTMAPEQIMQTWFPAGVQGMEQMQKMFWGGLEQMMTQPAGKPEKKK